MLWSPLEGFLKLPEANVCLLLLWATECPVVAKKIHFVSWGKPEVTQEDFSTPQNALHDIKCNFWIPWEALSGSGWTCTASAGFRKCISSHLQRIQVGSIQLKLCLRGPMLGHQQIKRCVLCLVLDATEIVKLEFTGWWPGGKDAGTYDLWRHVQFVEKSSVQVEKRGHETIHKYLRSCEIEDTVNLFPVVPVDQIRSNGIQWQQGRLELNFRKNFLMVRTVCLPQKEEGSPSLEDFKK